MNEQVKKMMEESNFSGTISIRSKGESIFDVSNGYRDRANKIENNIDTLYGIASGAKFFTALGILVLVENGKLSLDDKISDYLNKEFKHYDKSVTIKHLITHTSGLPDYYDEDEIDGEFHVSIPWFKLTKPSDYIEVLPDKEMKFSPGTKFNYNNSGFILLAYVIEKLTGDYYSFIDEHVINKSGMKRTGYHRFDMPKENTANGYVELKDGYKTNIYNLPIRGGGDGGIFTTANDIHLLWKAFFDGLIISKETVKEMITPIANLQGNIHYGLGVWIEKENHNPFIMGEDYGVTFETGYNLQTDECYVILSNNCSEVYGLYKEIKEKL